MPKSKEQLAREAEVGRQIRYEVEKDLVHRANNGTAHTEEEPKQELEK